ncbi:hypothetical protein [Sporolactobacillus inulinus]|uniref:Uncharacterized protein n=1 Tax=Sporolactobacillus inulinus CASD TaxID=1069536 RepID=A0A0U1QQB0_9BACL|nr:hypothetical protein [Sporolactobacillus inulinus]KLI02989.1 hypothetical protein SINU_05080 [Sporolactobacillus inulinus CASD]GEB77507.1 hypothetical protein SIN01_18520 [Sporolactobacillus inulinus]
MLQFSFYLEYDGRRTVSTYDAPTEVIRANGLLEALSLFAEKRKLKKAGSETLENGQVRAYFVQKKLFSAPREYVYMVREANKE